MKSLRLAYPLLTLALLAAGCGQDGNKLSDRDLSEARTVYSEAKFAMDMRDWTRAEPLLLRAIKITPEPEFFQNLGSVRMRLKNRAGAKEAYESAVVACERAATAKQGSADPLLKKIQLLALLGKTDDARKLQARVEKDFPQDQAVRAFVEGRKLDALIASPFFKETAL